MGELGLGAETQSKDELNTTLTKRVTPNSCHHGQASFGVLNCSVLILVLP